MRWLETRGIRPPPPDDIVPNSNDPAAVPPSTVGPDQLVTPGDPSGVVLDDPGGPSWSPPRIIPSAWSGWPAEWWTPNWTRVTQLTGVAWACIDLNARNLATMPPYLVGAAPTLDANWLLNPDPDIYSSWEEFSKQLFWDFQASGEAFVFATARYSTGWPARFHVLPPWTVNVEMESGRRMYTVGRVDITRDVCHLRYQSSVDDAHGHGPLEAGRGVLTSAGVLGDYANTVAGAGLVPSSILEAPEEMSPDQAGALRDEWVAQRAANPGYPAVLSGGLKWTPTTLNPKDMALLELAQYTDAKIAILLGVPPPLVGLPTAGESLTYNTVLMALDQHWRTGLRPMAATVMAGLSEWLLPRGTTIEVNENAYIQPDPKTRAETYQILNGIMDQDGNPALTVEQIHQVERLLRSATPPTNVGVTQ